VSREIPSGKPLRLLRMLYDSGKATTTYTLNMKQSDLAKQLNISRQALNVHLRKLRTQGLIRTGRGFIDVTEKGLAVIGVSVNPAFVFIKVSPFKRVQAYKEMMQFPVERIYRVTGDMDAIIQVGRESLDEALKRVAELEGVEATRSYITIQTIK